MTEIPGFLKDRNWVDFQTGDDYDASVEQLVWGITGEKSSDHTNVSFIDIPIVIAAMTKDEAQSLENGSVFDSPSVRAEDKEHFLSFLEFFHQSQFDDWVTHYGEYHEEWRPYLKQKWTIKDLLWDMFADYNTMQYDELTPSLLRPKIISSKFFSSNDKIRIESWKELKSTGGCLIIDSLSLFHPGIRECIKNSPILGDEGKVAIVVLSPINPLSHPVNKAIEDKINLRLKSAFMRLNNPSDNLCAYGIGDIRNLQRWFYNILPTAVSNAKKQSPSKTNRENIRQLMGEPKGMKRLVFGEVNKS
jgi:hypothetical protein